MVKNFNRQPFVEVPGREEACFAGWESIGTEIIRALEMSPGTRKVIVVETYQGVHYEALLESLVSVIRPGLVVDTRDLFRPEAAIRTLTWPDVTDDRVFGYMSRLNMSNFLDVKRLADYASVISNYKRGIVLVFGYGASLVPEERDLLVYADMARWEIQQRMRRNEVSNLGISNLDEHPELKYKRGFFVDWRVCDRLKKRLMGEWDFVLDTNRPGAPLMATGEAVREGLNLAVRQPFSLVPFFDPGPWGGKWMKDRFELEEGADNYAWCFNCIPEENSLLLRFGDHIFEIPSINLVFYRPVELLGHPVHARFGTEFPIRFDFLDTMEGGNLSLQVHPLTEYIQERFGMHYTQDESYYLVEAKEDGSVYLGLREGIDPDRMVRELRESEAGEVEFDVEKYIEKWPAAKHDHFLIPAGTIHCSGRNGMVLEISATPYIFTFKLYDWGRKGMDGKPRPINLEHGIRNIQWERNTRWTRENLVNRIEKIAEGDGWTEERTGLHEREFIETRRHWFTRKVTHHTFGGVNVMNLVEGEEVVVESPTNAFEPFVVRYAETFIVPASVGEYTIRPHGDSEGKKCATIKAFVRVNA